KGEGEGVVGRVGGGGDGWDGCIGCLERAVSLEPRNASFCNTLADTYRQTRRYQECDRMFENALALTPPEKYGWLPIIRACARLEHSADPAPLRDTVTAEVAAHRFDEEDTIIAQMVAALWSHDSAAMSRILSGKHFRLGWNGVTFPDGWFEGLIARMQGDNPAALKAFAVARPKLEEQISDNANPGLVLSILAIVDAGLGRAEQAVQEGKRACELIKTNNLEAPTVRGNLAVVYAWTGQNDLALAELSKLIDGPAGSNSPIVFTGTYGDFRMNPVWDPLRSDPRFEALVQRLASSSEVKQNNH